jgi:predicted ATPase with chaperone activity
LSKLEKEGLCAPVSGSFLFSSVQYSISKKGREKNRGISEENPYIGVAPVSYDNYDDHNGSPTKRKVSNRNTSRSC